MELVILNPKLLWLLLSVPLLIIIHFLSFKFVRRGAIQFANYKALERIARKAPVSTNFILLGVRLLAVSLLVLAVAGTVVWYEGKGSDYDFVLALDASSSMLIEDFNPTRLDSAKEVLNNFMDMIPKGLEIGVVSFAGTAFVEQRLTKDYAQVKDVVDSIRVRPIGGTNLGEAIITASNLFMNEEKGKVIVLLTDGRSTTGIPVEEAVDYANINGVVIHTIGIGTEEGGLLSLANVTLSISEKELLNIANATSGDYYNALDRDMLSDSFSRISTTSTRKIKLEMSTIFLVIALSLLILEWTLINTRFITLP
ncbi:hypothetical protein CMO89_03395 [Candidatus Woesearchaeota archaeon]|nr:hypothetical protein [Candidatus Woesearchaeota archaeon]|tara:strand:+ start:4170 stop:5102 length:933 start_codon:yes stop_codon:yes gene_type:complete